MTLVEQIAGFIEEDYLRTPGALLPSRKDLASRYKASIVTVAKALGRLRTLSKIDYVKGRKARVSDPGSRRRVPPSPIVLPARELLRRHVLDGIAATVYKAGEMLPKNAYLCRRFHIAPATVSRTLQELEREDEIYKEGKSYRVGSKPLSINSHNDSIPAAVFLIMDGEFSWKRLFAERTARFCHALKGELEHRGITLMPVYTNENVARPKDTAGLESAIRLAGDLHGRYLGALIPLSVEEIPEIKQWIARLENATRRPIVWFDRHGFDPPLPYRKNLYQCRFSEQPAIDLALQHLYSYGHRRIAYSFRSEYQWQITRHTQLEKAAANFDGMTLHGFRDDDSDTWACLKTFYSNLELFARVGDARTRESIDIFVAGRKDLRRRIETIYKNRHPGRVFDILKALAPAAVRKPRYWYRDIEAVFRFFFAANVLRFIEENDITSLVLPSDEGAVISYDTLRLAGVKIPETLSLLSFDNRIATHPRPISSVDFGFGSLGYWAAHVFLQDIVVPSGRNGVVRLTPFVNHLGSTGPSMPPNRTATQISGLLRKLSL